MFTKTLRFFSSSKNVIIKSKYPNLKIPDIKISDFFWERFKKWPNRKAMVCSQTGESVTYNDFFKKSRKISGFLQSKLKLKKGDTLAIVLPNVNEFGVVLLGAIDTGLKVTTINPLYTKDEMSRQLKETEVKVIFALNSIINVVKEASKSFNNISIISVSIDKHESVLPGVIKFEEIIQNNSFDFNPVPCKPEDVALILYSSGTTGLPKGVQLTNKNLVANVLQSCTEDEINVFGRFEDKTVISNTMAFFHSGGNSVSFSSWFYGSLLLTNPRFSKKSLANEYVKYKPNIGCYSLLIIQMLSDDQLFEPKTVKSLKIIQTGGVQLNDEKTKRFTEKYDDHIKVLQSYGLTEASPIVNRLPLNAAKDKDKSVGVLISNTMLKIAPTDGTHTEGLPVGETGEILLKGPQIMKGYLKNEKATKDTITEDGWLRTGDMGHVDSDGYLYVTERLKELIKVKGYQVAPAELEELLRSHPSVEETVVVGSKHDKYGEVPKAFVVLKRDKKSIGEDDIKNFVAKRVISYKRLDGGVVFIDELPKNAIGKILRKELKKVA